MEEKKLIMAEVTDNKNIRLRSWSRFIMTVSAIIIAAVAINSFHLRLDLTEDRRYTLSKPTLRILDNLRNDIYIQVYLDGEMPIPLKRLRRSVREMLEEFRIASNRRIDYEFINPADTKDERQRDARYTSLYNKGLTPVNIKAGDEEGGSSQKLIFPGMIVNYNGIEVPVNFLKNNQALSSEQNILNSMEGLEYEMIQTISTISSDTIYKVAFLEGQGELPEIEVADITLSLAKFFTVDRGSIGGKQGVLDKYSAVIIAGPEKEFSEPDKLVLDQYIMKGGKVLWLFDEVSVNADSLIVNRETIGLYRPLNIEDMLFRYGARVNPEIIQDIDCAQLRLVVMTGAEQKQIVPFSWFYYPLLTPNQTHPVTRNLNRVKGEFSNTIDTVGLDPAIKKSVLLATSGYSRTLSPPIVIRLKEVEQAPVKSDFNKSALPAALLLEGIFPSAFKNRVINGMTGDNFKLITSSTPTKMIVVGDRDIIRNELSRTGGNVTHLPLGQDKYTGELFGNRDFLINCMNYLVDDNGLMGLRSREMKLRLLDKQRIKEEKVMWQLINIAGPVLLVIIAGLIYGFFRKKKYTKIL